MGSTAWPAAEGLIPTTARVERSDGEGGWAPRGTAFFIAPSILLTCAHVVLPGATYRVVWYGGDGRCELPATVTGRYPDCDPLPDGPYPLPDVAVLDIGEGAGTHPIVWLDDAAPGTALYAYGFTDEYSDEMLGHGVRLENVGEDQTNEGGGNSVWRVKGDRVRGGMSGAPVLDLATARVVGIVKRTQSEDSSIGGFFTSMASVIAEIPQLAADNHAANRTPETDDTLAVALWGDLVDRAAGPLIDSAAARDALARELGIEDELYGDDRAQARRIARALFVLDLDRLIDCVTRLAQDVDAADARKVFEAVGVCTVYRGEPWVAATAATELGAQVDRLRNVEGATGRVLHLRSSMPQLRTHYLTRGNRRRRWWRPLDLSGPYSADVDPETGLPADLERELRILTARKFRSAAPECTQDELDAKGVQAWNDGRPGWVATLRERGVVGLIGAERLDVGLVEALVKRYPLVFFVAFDDDVASDVAGLAAYQSLDPDVDDQLARKASDRYGAMCDELDYPD